MTGSSPATHTTGQPNRDQPCSNTSSKTISAPPITTNSAGQKTYKQSSQTGSTNTPTAKSKSRRDKYEPHQTLRQNHGTTRSPTHHQSQKIQTQTITKTRKPTPRRMPHTSLWIRHQTELTPYEHSATDSHYNGVTHAKISAKSTSQSGILLGATRHHRAMQIGRNKTI